MDAEAITIKNSTNVVIWILSYLPIISVGFVKILSMSENFWFKSASDPATINIEKKEKIIKLISKLKFPLPNSLVFLTFLEMSPKLIINIEK